MAYFETKTPNLDKFWKVLQWNMLVYVVAIWSRYCTAIWYTLWILSSLGIFISRFGMFYQEKSGSPDTNGTARGV
jgi:hypothetical protein